jgi:hypothetical protein
MLPTGARGGWCSAGVYTARVHTVYYSGHIVVNWPLMYSLPASFPADIFAVVCGRLACHC